MNAASVLFGRHGFGGTSVRAITDAAGANLGAVTYHFKSKAALFSAVMEPKLAVLARRSTTIAESREAAPLKLRLLYREYVQCVLSREPSLRAVFSDLVHGGGHLTQNLMAHLLSLHATVAGIIREGVEQGDFRDGNIEHTVRMAFGTIVPWLGLDQRPDSRKRMARFSRAEASAIAESGFHFIMNGFAVSDRRRCRQVGGNTTATTRTNRYHNRQYE